MKATKENKYLVIKLDDLENYFSQFTKGVFTTDKETKHMSTLTWQEVLDEVKNNNKYIVCNQDEPYADLIRQIILLGEDAKQKDWRHPDNRD